MNSTSTVRNPRAHVIASRSIQLTEQLPRKRLDQLCEQGKFSYTVSHDQFENGYLVTCKLDTLSCTEMLDMLTPLTKEVRWVETSVSQGGLEYATNVVIASMLDRMGLGEPEAEPEEESQPSDTPETTGKTTIETLFDKLLDDSSEPTDASFGSGDLVGLVRWGTDMLLQTLNDAVGEDPEEPEEPKRHESEKTASEKTSGSDEK